MQGVPRTPRESSALLTAQDPPARCDRRAALQESFDLHMLPCASRLVGSAARVVDGAPSRTSIECARRGPQTRGCDRAYTERLSSSRDPLAAPKGVKEVTSGAE
jgi:hypothetical protein